MRKLTTETQRHSLMTYVLKLCLCVSVVNSLRMFTQVNTAIKLTSGEITILNRNH